MHFCADEWAVLAAALPTLAIFFRWVKAKLTKFKRGATCPHSQT